MLRAIIVAVAGGSLLVPLWGCGSGSSSGNRVKLSGVLLFKGKALKIQSNEDWHMEFRALTKDKTQTPVAGTTIDPETGQFQVTGPFNDGLEPGEYKITLSCTPEGKEEDRFQEAFSEYETPLRYTVTKDNPQEIVIDLGKRTVTKKN